ncbi:MAG: TetR/AcrR family transcriptional regulator [Rhizobiaceae bacterium]
MSDTEEQLLDLAEDRIRLRGYHAVSFRELADELGIKSSSVHYYFPQKQDLGLALVQRYSEKVFGALEVLAEKATTPGDYLNALVSVYRDALTGSDRICLCGMLGAENSGLPAPVALAVTGFLNKNVEWLAENLDPSLSSDVRRATAIRVVSNLQGAMVLANSMRDHAIFDQAVEGLSVSS